MTNFTIPLATGTTNVTVTVRIIFITFSISYAPKTSYRTPDAILQVQWRGG